MSDDPFDAAVSYVRGSLAGSMGRHPYDYDTRGIAAYLRSTFATVTFAEVPRAEYWRVVERYRYPDDQLDAMRRAQVLQCAEAHAKVSGSSACTWSETIDGILYRETWTRPA